MTDVLLRGEQAVLGAVLLDPAQLDTLYWLTPADFYRPAHRAMFAAMRTLSTDGRPGPSTDGTVPLSWVTDTVAEAGRHVRGLSASYAHTLIAACPRPQNAPVYGRLVLEGSIHRTVAEHAARLEHIAQLGAGQHQVDDVVHHADVLASVLGDLARRWGTGPRPVPPPRTGPSEAPSPAGPEQSADERLLLSVLVSRPAAMGEVYDWLRPGDFAGPGHGQLYRCLGALHHRGEPIDEVTALWEVQRRGLLADGTLSQELLDGILGGPGAGSAEWLSDQVIRSSLVRTAARAATDIKALAEDQSLAPGRLIGQALHALGPLDEVRARWTRAADPPPPRPETGHTARVHAALARSAHTTPSTQPAHPPATQGTATHRHPVRSTS
ncbi:DnaB-like helicase N-terminal domain-containing protein [Kitasatospora sp. NPDC093806]|uniref:DnaB-like helicase N-terminal domain-containing protein n=1 Tax=Kitasatospora sp. NPDC093806 TaxID=3155075 RepID=UPI00341F18EB